MMVNKRVEETMFSETPENEKNKTKEYRVLPKHMYGVSIDYWPQLQESNIQAILITRFDYYLSTIDINPKGKEEGTKNLGFRVPFQAYFHNWGVEKLKKMR